MPWGGLLSPTGLTVSLPQNEGETWTKQSPDHLHQPPSVREEELKWEKEPGTQITVTIKEEEETDHGHGQKIEEDKHQIHKEAEEEEQGREEEQDERIDEKNKTRDERQIQEEIQGVDQSIPPSVNIPLSGSYTFKPKQSKTKHPKDKQIAKTKKNKQKKEKAKERSSKPLKNSKKTLKQEKDQLTTASYFPYFKDHYCPPDCACYGRCVSNTALHMLRLTSVKFSDL